MTPFAGYVNFADCTSKNQDKSDPDAYCGKIKHQVEDAIPSCVFARMGCLEKKYPDLFTLSQRLNMAHDFCLTHHDTEDFGNGSLFSYVEDTIGSKTLKGLREYRTLKDVWEIVRTIGVPILYDKEKKVEYEGKLVLKKLTKKDFLVEDAKPYYGSKIGSGKTPPEQAQKKAEEAYQAYKKSVSEPNEAAGTQLRNLPETPVSSSNVMTEAVVNNRLYLRFHSSPEFSYKYSFGSNEEALTAADELTKGSPGRYVWKNLRGKELGPVFGKPNKLTPGGTSASLVPYDKSRYTRIKQYMGRMPEIEAKYGSLEEIAENLRQTKMGIKEERAPEEETEPGELEAGGTSGAPFRPKELEKYQKGIYKEKEKRKKYKEEAKSMIAELRKKHQGDYVVDDSMDELFEWVQNKIESDPDEAKRIAFAISRYREGKGKKEESPLTEEEYAIANLGRSQFPSYKEYTQKEKEKGWKKDWNAIAKPFKKAREQYRQMKKGEELQFKRSVYGSLDLTEQIDYLEEQLASHGFYLEDHWDEFYDFIEGYDKDFDPNQKGKWITSKGKHIFIPEGHSLQFGEGGNYSTSKAEELKKKIQEKHLQKKSLSEIVAEEKAKQEKKKAKKEPKKKEPSLSDEEKEELRRRKEIEKRARSFPKAPKPRPEREQKIRKLIEKTGYSRERAEQEINKKTKAKEEETRKKEEPSKKEPTVSKSIQTKISKKQEAINKRLEKLRSVSRGKSSNQSIGGLINLTLRMLQQASQKGGSPIIPFAYYVSKVKKNNTLKEQQKASIISEIDKLKKEISSLKQDFRLLNETIELEEELEQYDFHLEDHLEEFYKFQKNNEVNIIHE